MRILVLGSGGREHAFAWKLSQSPKVSELYIAPGNAGVQDIATVVNIAVDDFPRIKDFVLSKAVDMVVVGPEVPLVKGIHDFFLHDEQLKNTSVIGPRKAAATLEGSKDFAKRFMQRYGIPTAEYRTFDKTQIADAENFLEGMSSPYVIKADGLAAGKGVLISEDLNLAKAYVKDILLDAKFGEAGDKIVIESYLDGIESSVFVLTDGDNYKILPTAKDYKRIGEGDTGLNTGGMGAISPPPFVDEEFLEKIESSVVIPTIDGLKRSNLPYRGFIFIGLMKVGGDPYVIEYNIRMGDPETQVVLPRLKTDLAELLEAVGQGTLEKVDLEVYPHTTATIVVASEGYPETYKKGEIIRGLDNVSASSIVFHAGTALKQNRVVTDGGRVMAITDSGNSHAEAVNKAYRSVEKIYFDGLYYRKDIGFDL